MRERLSWDRGAIQAKVLGIEHPAYATTLNNLAVLYEKVGDDARAQSLHLELKRIREKALSRVNLL